MGLVYLCDAKNLQGGCIAYHPVGFFYAYQSPLHNRRVLTVSSTVKTYSPPCGSLQRNGNIRLFYSYYFLKSYFLIHQKAKNKMKKESIEQIALRIKSLTNNDTLESIIIDTFSREMQSVEFQNEYVSERKLLIADMMSLLLRLVYA